MNPLSSWRSHAAVSTLLLVFVLAGTTYSIVTPAFETPDEIWHYAFIQHLASGQGLPVATPNTQAMWKQQGVQAPGYYLVAAALTAWIDQSDFSTLYARANPHRAIGQPNADANYNFLIHHNDEGWPWRGSLLALHIARLFSVLLGAITVWATYRTLALLIPPMAALTAAAAVAFIPQFLFISAAVSNDNAVNAMAALVIWRLSVLVMRPDIDHESNSIVRAQLRQLRVDLWILGCLLGIAVLSKLSALGLIVPAGLAILTVAWRQKSLRVVSEAVLGMGIPIALIGGWWYMRNWQLYGDPLAWNVWQDNILLRVQPAGLRQIAAELTSLEHSFWGLFGWLNVAYPPWVYTSLRAIEGLIGLGIVVAATHWFWKRRTASSDRWLAALLSLLWLAILAASWLRFMRIAPAAQGRYFFPAMPAIALLLYLGVHAWRVWTLRWLVVLILFGLSAITPFWIIKPAYSPPPPDLDKLNQLASVSAQVGEDFAIIGLNAQPATLLPGQQAQVQIAWRAERTPSADYSVFVHLVDSDDLIVAQFDTMPGGGLAPTSQWTPSQTRVDSYPVSIPKTAYTPNRGRWAVGLYSAISGTEQAHRLPVALISPSDTGNSYFISGSALHFGEVEISTPAGDVPNPIHAQFLDNISLSGYTFSQRLLKPGDRLTVILYWTARGAVKQEYTTFVHLLDHDYQMFGGSDDEPDPPTDGWQERQIIVDEHTFIVPSDTPPGPYQIELGLYTRPEFDRLALLESGAEGADRLLLGPLKVRP